ncbi:adk [Wigglesworthia glossinidia endosymbiont of Glossina brevipalpis]|uniref:Adenylate kinase n=1 Tax=Wigglesworthia glossinidia brevipalpis TaxID=36870 RepID=KAD_WIGBR|nr:RecName: Full=Adenylate kinase; Short=AK; AltName: Full=ATP-AMP transphosphorylase; AltName: Full=ATP:AMP phosphotransferase; AltName: Full=Adenylate monophosphate kinase [Wigglesworthia glossinidia endosymbiont of Glossina brevipalpis]BAC24674.1 adk [Wigglesworthia glossinidia endosymbiont of Glossina brevipalpis]
MRIILIGSPGSGKGTQAKIMSKKYNLPHISCGDILRKQNKCCDINKLIKKGELINDKLVTNIVLEKLKNINLFKGFILDGFPRTLYQANSIKENKIKIDYVLELFLQEKYIYERVLGRIIDKVSGEIYHLKFNPPKFITEKSNKNKILVRRLDDKKSALQKRINDFFKNSCLISEFYKKESLEKKLKYKIINADFDINTISNKIFNIINV